MGESPVKLEAMEQESLLIKSKGWLEIQLLRIVHQIDTTNECLISHKPPLPLSELRIEPSGVVRSLLTAAKSIQKLHLDNAQLAVISALFLFQPDSLPEVRSTLYL